MPSIKKLMVRIELTRPTFWSTNVISKNFLYCFRDCLCLKIILSFSLFSNDEFKSSPKDCLEVESQITGLKFHFSLSSVFVYTTEHCKTVLQLLFFLFILTIFFNFVRLAGRLYWHDINENVENNSKNFIELIASAVKFSWVDIDSILYLAIAASDGRLYLISAESIPDERMIYRMLVD